MGGVVVTENEEIEDGESVSSEMERDTPSVDGRFACCEANVRLYEVYIVVF
jgi:hypothetical protein